MDNLIGRDFGRYHILEQLGEGGMATVYKAFDTRLETDVAIKVIRTENLTQAGIERALKRFEREAKALAKLTHPNIVPIIDYGEFEGSPYLVMKYLPGGTLKHKLGKPIPWQDAARLLLPIAQALAYAHEQGIVHRDVKPSNILMTGQDQPMLTDFGVAKVLEVDETLDLTGTGVGVGTPEYMAPEQGLGKRVDGRADIYSLGVVFYELLTGVKPYQADTPMAVLHMQMSDPLPSPNRFVPGLPEEVVKVILKALAKDPQNRYQTSGEFAQALEKLAAQSIASVQPVRHNRARIWSLAGGCVGLIGLLIGGYFAGRTWLGWGVSQPKPANPQPSRTAPAASSPSPLPTEAPTETPFVFVSLPFKETFDDMVYNGDFNTAAWDGVNRQIGTIKQEDGHLSISMDTDKNINMALGYKFPLKIGRVYTAETDLMLAGKTTKLNNRCATMTLSTVLPEKGYIITCELCNGNAYGTATASCSIVNSSPILQWDVKYSTLPKDVHLDEWHNFKMELAPDASLFTFYFDHEKFGEYVPVEKDDLLRAEFTFGIGIYNWTQAIGPVQAYFDNVLIEPLP